MERHAVVVFTEGVSGDRQMIDINRSRNRRCAVWIALGMSTVFFIMDRFIPLGVAAGISHVAAVLVCMWSGRPRDIVLVMCAGMFLTLVGMVSSPTPEIDLVHWKWMTNRVLSVAAILATGCAAASQCKLKRMLMKFAAAIEYTSSSIVITNTDGDIKYVNSGFCELTGYTSREVLGQNLRILQSGECSREMWRTVLAGDTWRGETKYKRKDGTLFWESATITPVRDSHGNIENLVAVKEDITDRKRMEDEIAGALDRERRASAELEIAKKAAEGADIAKGKFLANMSHEIRTPMTAILGYSEILEEEGDIDKAPPERIRAISAIRQNGDHLLHIINDILDLSKLDAGMIKMKMTPCNPAEMARNSLDTIRPRVGDGVSLECDIATGVPREFGCSNVRLRQILLNLVGNAAKFTDAGEIRVKVECADGRITFDVSDTGCGMCEQDAVRLFAPFQQADSSPTREHGGTGLGLVISKRLANLLGGDVTLKETSEGRGATFSLDLPCDAAPLRDHESRMYQETRETLGLRVLLADDSEDNRTVIGAMLKRFGADVVFAVNGEHAIEKVMDSEFDVILMDMHMPVMGGVDATRVLREGGYDGPIIAVTGCVMEKDVEECLAAGCDSHLPKPVTSESLMGAIASSCFAFAA